MNNDNDIRENTEKADKMTDDDDAILGIGIFNTQPIINYWTDLKK